MLEVSSTLSQVSVPYKAVLTLAFLDQQRHHRRQRRKRVLKLPMMGKPLPGDSTIQQQEQVWLNEHLMRTISDVLFSAADVFPNAATSMQAFHGRTGVSCGGNERSTAQQSSPE